MELYTKGTAHYPSRFWLITTEPIIEGTNAERPAANLNEHELARYKELVEKGHAEPALGDVLDKFRE